MPARYREPECDYLSSPGVIPEDHYFKRLFLGDLIIRKSRDIYIIEFEIQLKVEERRDRELRNGAARQSIDY